MTDTEHAAAPPVEIDLTEPDNEDVDAQPCADYPLDARVEALLVATDRPLPESRLADLLGISGKGVTNTIREAIDQLNADYAAGGRSFRAKRLAGGWQILTEPDFGPLLSRLNRDRQQSHLSPAAMETLSIVAYRQPMMRAELEAIRGVSSGEVLRGLMERRLVKIVGRAEELGRPMLYGTTNEFLKVFGLSGLDDLPAVEGLSPQRTAPKRAKAAPVADDAEGSDSAEAGASRESEASGEPQTSEDVSRCDED